jgi:hypothetical protein
MSPLKLQIVRSAPLLILGLLGIIVCLIACSGSLKDGSQSGGSDFSGYGGYGYGDDDDNGYGGGGYGGYGGYGSYGDDDYGSR